MIVKITRGRSVPRLVSYLFGPGKANEHYDQRVIALAASLEETPIGELLSREQVRDLSRGIDAIRIAHRIPAGPPAPLRAKALAGGPELPGLGVGELEKEPKVPAGHVWHLSLTNPAGDRVLEDFEWRWIAEGAMEAMGFTEASGKAPVRWVAVRHGLSPNGNDHLHIAVTLVRDDGTRASVFRDYKTMSAYAATVEREHWLSVVDGRRTAGLPGVSRGEMEKANREGRAEPVRTRWARIVREAAVNTRDEAEFVRRLRQTGLTVRPRFADGGRDAVVGFSVGVKDKSDKTILYGGGSLAPDLSLPRLREFWESSPRSTQAAVMAWRGAKREGGRETLRLPSVESTRQAAALIDQAYKTLRDMPPDDHEQWASVAREVAGVYAAWSRRVEGKIPGPLARAADALARTAQVAPNTPSPVRSPKRGYRSAAMVAAQGTNHEESGPGWTQLLAQLNRTLRLLARVHEVRGELRQADQLWAIEGDLEALCKRGGARPRGDRQRGSRGPGSARGAARAAEYEDEEAQARRRQMPGPDRGMGR
jgi:hypothetical protein